MTSACLRVVAALLAFALAAPAAADGGDARARPWSPAVVELAASLPVQDGGRVKPMHTLASYTLLGLSGRRSVTTPRGEELSAIEWLLDVLVFPRAADGYAVFLVDDDDVVDAIGLAHDRKGRRDRYSFDELRAGTERLFELAAALARLDDREPTSVERQLLALASDVRAYRALAGCFDFAREGVAVGPGEALAELAGERAVLRFADVLELVGPLLERRDRLVRGRHDDGGDEELRAVGDLLLEASRRAAHADALALLPPPAGAAADAAWRTPADVFAAALEARGADPAGVVDVRMLEELVLRRGAPDAFEDAFAALHRRLVGRATDGGRAESVGLELAYHRSRILDSCQAVYALAFLLAAFSWLRPRSALLGRATFACVLVATLALIAAIVVRCVIRGRPPVSTLYETVLFVTAAGASLAMVAEAIDRRRVALSTAALLGLVGLALAGGYERLDASDTMPQLVAVLDTNFWLSTHVVAVTLGYAAGVLAALLASVYLLTKVFGWRRFDATFHGSLARTVYGVLCFALLFSTVGTILGGIWAGDSWGRFWGWDPKENGALLIVLTQLAILHARAGGHLRDHGVCMAAAFGGTVVAFSWWGVNLLGVGLHSYGFTSGVHEALWTYYVLQWSVVGLGAVAWFRERARGTTG